MVDAEPAMSAPRAYVPAAGHDRWLRFYDPLTRLLGAPAALRALIEQADLQPGQQVLEIGCGTGNLTVMLQQRHPRIDVVALDPDAHALDIARQKGERTHSEIKWVQGFGDAIPYPAAAFDRVLSSFMLHHLTHAEKRATLSDAFRVLKAGGSMHIVDFAGPGDHQRGFIARLLHRGAHLHDNAEGRITALLEEVGFDSVARVAMRQTLFGPISFYRAGRGA
jgi:ubiquinone/menaquinone biosynthesis C-methylase UbiE